MRNFLFQCFDVNLEFVNKKAGLLDNLVTMLSGLDTKLNFYGLALDGVMSP